MKSLFVIFLVTIMFCSCQQTDNNDKSIHLDETTINEEFCKIKENFTRQLKIQIDDLEYSFPSEFQVLNIDSFFSSVISPAPEEKYYLMDPDSNFSKVTYYKEPKSIYDKKFFLKAYQSNLKWHSEKCLLIDSCLLNEHVFRIIMNCKADYSFPVKVKCNHEYVVLLGSFIADSYSYLSYHTCDSNLIEKYVDYINITSIK